MLKKATITLSFLLVLTALSITLYFSYFRRKPVESESVNPQITPMPTIELINWQDPTQFSINYPKDLIVNTHTEDDKNYAHLQLSKADKKGYLIIWVKDANASTLQDFVKKNKLTDSIQTTLSDIEAVKTILTDEDGVRELNLYCIKDGYLYQLEVRLEDFDYWNDIFNLVSNSFQFTQDNISAVNDASQDTNNRTNEIIEEEEFIE